MIGYVWAFDTPWRDKWKERWRVTDPQESRFPSVDSAGGFPLPPLICTVDMQRPSQGKAAEVPRLHMFRRRYVFAKLNTNAPFSCALSNSTRGTCQYQIDTCPGCCKTAFLSCSDLPMWTLFVCCFALNVVCEIQNVLFAALLWIRLGNVMKVCL